MKRIVMVETLNVEIAHRLEEVAQLLEAQCANPFRVQAHRNAAQTLHRLDLPVTELLQHEGMEGLRQLRASARVWRVQSTSWPPPAGCRCWNGCGGSHPGA